MEIPSETEIVPNCIGNPPASITPCLDAFAKRSRDKLHGVISFQDDAIPICGLIQSSSPIPTARNIPRAGARSIPSVTNPERGFIVDIVVILTTRPGLNGLIEVCEHVRHLLGPLSLS
ncbi:unannotated protein [freshwater metagenome]|uniref:Unannotated protein n=1 Tax=freshwater metagenome TaxID=449393 RepID=A0A6J7BH08_9ZZZZ